MSFFRIVDSYRFPSFSVIDAYWKNSIDILKVFNPRCLVSYTYSRAGSDSVADPVQERAKVMKYNPFSDSRGLLHFPPLV